MDLLIEECAKLLGEAAAAEVLRKEKEKESLCSICQTPGRWVFFHEHNSDLAPVKAPKGQADQ